MIKLNGFSVFRNDRKNRVGGGVAIYVKDTFKFIPLSSSPSDVPSGSIEYLIGAFTLPNQQKILTAAVYRPPNSPFFKNSDFFKQLDLFLPDYATKIIMGDFNADMLTQNPQSNIVNKFLIKNSLQLIPHGVTNTSTDRGTQLDLCIADSNDTILHYGKSPSPFINSHFLISATFSIFKTATHPSIQFTYRNLNKIDQAQFQNFLSSSDWVNFYGTNQVDEKLFQLHSILTQALDVHAPMVTISPSQKFEPWITENLFILQKRVYQLYQKYKRKRTTACRKEYRKLHQELNNRLRSARIEYYKSRLKGLSSPKEVWRELRNLGLTESPTLKTPVLSPNELNDFFISASNPPSSSSSLPSSHLRSRRISTLPLQRHNPNRTSQRLF